MKDADSGPSRTTRQKQLLFDRRYGWVYEEWTDPVEVANIGGRGMFSVVPLTAAMLDGTIRLANLAADAVARALLTHQLPSGRSHEQSLDVKEEAGHGGHLQAGKD